MGEELARSTNCGQGSLRPRCASWLRTRGSAWTGFMKRQNGLRRKWLEHNRPADKALPDRYSRHYHDVAMMDQGPIRNEALSDMPLLAQVVRCKETFYPSGWARYGLGRLKSRRLVPTEQCLTTLQRDCRNMVVMIFGAAPDFEQILDLLKNLEQDINHGFDTERATHA
jgi:hypothetical protein